MRVGLFTLSSLVLFIVLAVAIMGCSEDEEAQNLPPETELFVDSIALAGENSLSSIVQLSWTGFDRDGYVVRYEYSLDDALTWTSTTATTDTFQFIPENGQQFGEVRFTIRSIDNDGNVDPSPAFLRIPVKNSPPTASRGTYNYNREDTVFLVASATFEFSDLDGDETVDSQFVKINDGPWIPIARISNNAITIIPNETLPGESTATIKSFTSAFDGAEIRNEFVLTENYPGLILEGENTVFYKVKDFTGAESQAAVLMDSVYFKTNGQNNLLLASFGTQPSSNIVYVDALNDLSISHTFVDFNEYFERFGVSYLNYELEEIVGFFNIVFYSSNAFFYQSSTTGHPAMLNAISTVIGNGGKLLYVEEVKDFALNDVRFQTYKETLPVDTFLIVPDGCALRLLTNRTINAVDSTTYPDLKVSSFVSNPQLFTPLDQPNVEILYDIDLSANLFGCDIADVNASSNKVVVAQKNLEGNTNLVYSAVQLYNLRNDQQAFNTLMLRIFNSEFNW